MAEQQPHEDLLKRRFEPVSDWRPARTAPLSAQIKAAVGGAMDDALKKLEGLEPITEEARDKIKEIASLAEDVASRSSNEARSFVAKALETVAEKIKPD